MEHAGPSWLAVWKDSRARGDLDAISAARKLHSLYSHEGVPGADRIDFQQLTLLKELAFLTEKEGIGAAQLAQIGALADLRMLTLRSPPGMSPQMLEPLR